MCVYAAPGQDSREDTEQLLCATMGIRIMKLVTLWLAASAESFRVHGASAAGSQGKAQGVQGRESATSRGLSKKQQRAAAAAAKEVCSVDDSPAKCRELTAKYRGGGKCGCWKQWSLD